MPVPRDAFPEEPDGAVGEARGGSVVPLPSVSDTSPPAAKKKGKKAPRKPGPRQPSVPADPGPPPPLPPDLVAPTDVDDIAIPPRPPLPVHVPETDEAAPVEAEADPIQPETVAEVEAPPEPEAPAALEAPAEPEAPDVPATVDERAAATTADPFASSVVLEDLPVEAPAALTLRAVTKSFGDTRAVDGVDLTVPAGTFYGLVGPNGAGKTTTLSLIAGLLRPDRGAIRIAGVDAVASPLEAKRLMGVLPDRLRTFDRLTGRQLLYYYGVLRALPSATVDSRIADLARAFDLTDALGRTVSDYSAGMLKKVMLAGALIHSPRVLVLDEPFEAVDPVSSAVILDILSAYVAHGGTVILSSHGMELVERICSRIAVMVAGQVLAEGTVDEVRGELTLEQRFVELAGGLSDVEGLEWLHTFSD